MKKVFITGARGFVGSNLVEKLKNNFDIMEYNRNDNIENITKYKPNYIIHCGAEIYDDNLMFESNVVLTYKILELVKNLSNVENFVYIGSSSEYGRKLKPMKEDDVLEPDTMYEGTKACGSLLTRVYGKTYNMMTSIVRPFSLYGKNEKLHKFFPHLYNCFTNDLDLKIGPGVHDWIYIDDFVEGVKKVMLNNNIIGESFHFGTGVQHTNFEVFKIFEKILKKEINYEEVHKHDRVSAGVDSNNWVADITKVKNTLNWYPKYCLEDGISEYINFRKKHNEKNK